MPFGFHLTADSWLIFSLMTLQLDGISSLGMGTGRTHIPLFERLLIPNLDTQTPRLKCLLWTSLLRNGLSFLNQLSLWRCERFSCTCTCFGCGLTSGSSFNSCEWRTTSCMPKMDEMRHIPIRSLFNLISLLCQLVECSICTLTECFKACCCCLINPEKDTACTTPPPNPQMKIGTNKSCF